MALGLLLAALAQSPADSLRLLAQRLPESALVLETRSRPLAVRDAIAEAMTRSVTTPAQSAEEIDVARRLAAAYALAWRDSFLTREVARFTAWAPGRRAAKVSADSVRRAGAAAFSRAGPSAAIAIWRRALARATAIHDTAGMAAALGNIGAGLVEEARLDSAAAYLERARRLAVAIGDQRVEANAVGMLASASEERGDLDAARVRYARALALTERIGDSRGLAAIYNQRGLLAHRVGDPDAARRDYEAALALNRRDGRDAAAATNLLNLAGLASLEGDFARAETLYRDALATWRSYEMGADAAAALHGLGQLEMRRGDYPAARAAALEALALYDRTGPLAAALAVRRVLAGALAASGELQGAVDELRQAQRSADSTGASPGVRAGLALARADLAIRLNAMAEADQLYTRAEQLYRQADDPGGVAEAQQGRGLLFLARDDQIRAQALLATALRTQLAAGNRRAAAVARLSLGQLLRRRGETAGARRQLARAAAELDRLGDPIAAAAALGELAALELDAALPATAESLYHVALGRLEGRLAPDVSWSLHAGLAQVFRARGQTDLAARELRSALGDLELPGRSLALAERRSGFFADKWDGYAQLALTERARGRVGAAFEASERLRGREMLELLARGRVAAPRDTAGELVAREQDLRRHIGELMRPFERVPAGAGALRGPREMPASGPRREALVRAQTTYAELLLEMRERAPRHAALLSPATVTWRDVTRRLRSGEAFIEYLVSDSSSVAFLVVRDTIAAVDLGVDRRELARLVELARGTIQSSGAPRGDALWRAPLRRLHDYLVAPLEETGLLAGITRLVLVPQAELHYLPFAALLGGERGGRFLVERYELAFTPSASVWLALGERPARSGTTGVLALAPRPDALPASHDEVALIARRAEAGGRVLIGPAATEAAFRADAPRRRVLHLATYGVLNRNNPLFSFVELAPGGGHDGRLEVHEVFGLELAADLVVLSACQTGLGSGALADVPAGDDWVGLTRAFLHAGAGDVVATLWPVEDRATAALMEQFYGDFESGADPARALAAAQRVLLATPATVHPFHWAGFVTVGGADARVR